jgi:hypothetical protein
MREGSYTQIKEGMRVVGRDGETIGGVDEVLADEASGIFVGLVVRPNAATSAFKVRGEAVDRLHDGVVYVDAVAGELEPYLTPEERFHEVEQAYEEAA